ncbi:MAG: hypothetical protein ACNA8W_13870 [Bradymonadaceae bacterium]
MKMKGWVGWGASLVVVGALGCAVPAAPAQATSGALSVADDGVVAQPAPVSDPVPTPRVDDVDWVEALGQESIDLGRLSEKQQEVVGRSNVPVLLPDGDVFLKAAILTVGEHWYAASMPLEGHSLVIQGTRQAFEVPGLSDQKKEPMINTYGHELTRTKGIVGLAFQAFGAAYMLDVECARPMEDVRCTEDAYILEVAESLAVVKGGSHE